jgi:peptidoglycan/LPS O-acetylase OafA/YrhL
MELKITLAALGLLLISSFVLKYYNFFPSATSKYRSVFGLRGFLVFIIFLYHAVIWYGYLQTGKWEWEDTRIYLARDCFISFFLMTTGFLFFNKLAEKKNKSIDWKVFFRSRFLRLGPVYYFVVTVMIFIVLVKTEFRLYYPLGRNIEDTLKWYTFTLVGTPNINHFKDTYLVIAGVQWIFIYEWIFYFSLPWAAFLLYRIQVPAFLLFLCVALVVLFCVLNKPALFFLLSFLSGLLASILNKNERILKSARHYLTSFVVLVSSAGIIFFGKKFNLIPFALATVIFCLVACGNDLFGILVSRISTVLGRISYSLFLTHGIVLYMLFNFIIGIERSGSLSPNEYSIVIISCILPTLVIATMIHYWIEAKFTGRRQAGEAN